MIYRVVTLNSIIPFNTYNEAKSYVNENGGTIYVKEISCVYNGRY